MVDIVFLGTSAGLPSKERGMPAIAMHAKEWLLFDCGEGTQRQMMKFGVPYGSIKAVFITHPHLDHYLGLYGLMETYKLALPHRKMPVFVPDGINMKRKNVDPTMIGRGKLYENNEFEVHAFPVKHVDNSFGFILQEKDRLKFNKKKAESLGIKGAMFREIENEGHIKVKNKKVKLKDITWDKKGRKIIYTGDTVPCKEVASSSRNADLLIHDCSFSSDYNGDAKEKMHSTSVDAAKTAKKSKVKKLVLTHISSRYKDTSQLLKEAKAIFPNTIMTEDGLKVKL